MIPTNKSVSDQRYGYMTSHSPPGHLGLDSLVLEEDESAHLHHRAGPAYSEAMRDRLHLYGQGHRSPVSPNFWPSSPRGRTS